MEPALSTPAPSVPAGATLTPTLWGRYVALGDSFTEGMSDPHPDAADAYVGWADRLAAALSDLAGNEGRDFTYANLAVRGRLLADVTGPQLDAALRLEPDLVSIVGGGNDILRPRADLDALAATLEEAVVALRATGADVLMATPVDPRDAPVVRHVRGRHAIHAANIWSIARRHGCAVIDQWGMAALKDWRMWGEDRIHMTTEGHRRVAHAALAALGHDPEDADWATPLPPEPPVGLVRRLRADRAWVVDHLAPWVHRRLHGRSSGDDRIGKRLELAPLASLVRDDAGPR